MAPTESPRHRLTCATPPQQRGDVLVRSRGGLGEMPGAACGLSPVIRGETAVDGAPLLSGCQINGRRPDHRMPERDAACAVVDPDEPSPFRRSQHVRRWQAGDGIESSQVARAVEDGCEQHVPWTPARARGGRAPHRGAPAEWAH